MSDFYEKHLKTFPSSDEGTLAEELPFFGTFSELARSFRKVTGYEILLVRNDQIDYSDAMVFPIPSNFGEMEYSIILQRNLTSMSLIPEHDVFALARAVADLLGETYSWQHALRQREAELASNVQLSFHLQKDYGLAERLRYILKTGTESIQCHAASLYLLDHETSMLKLRACWGLPEERLTDPPRQLNAALADLEAMLGHAVILNEDFLYERWNAPETFESSVCIPISSTTTIHGTLWFFSNEHRQFSDTDLALMEIVAGRIAVELERSALLREGHDAMILKRQLTDAEHALQSRLPKAEVGENAWQFAGSISHCKPLAATSYTWHNISPDHTLAVLVSTAEKIPNVEAQIRCAVLQAEVGYLVRYLKSPKRILEELQDIAFAEKAKKNSLEMMVFLVDHRRELLRLACSGHFIQFHATRHGIRPLGDKQSPRGLELSEMCRTSLKPCESLITLHVTSNLVSLKEQITQRLLSPQFLAETNRVVSVANAQVLAELFNRRFQEILCGENITVLAIKNGLALPADS